MVQSDSIFSCLCAHIDRPVQCDLGLYQAICHKLP